MDSLRPEMWKRKGKVPDNITCCCFSFDQNRRPEKAGHGLEIPA